MATWINFKELRESVRIADVLQRHNVQLKVRGDKATGLCPLPTHPARTDSQKRSPSFSVQLTKGIWHCFGCGAAGNVLDLNARLQGLDPDDPVQFRRAALSLAQTFGIQCERQSAQGPATKPGPKIQKQASSPVSAGRLSAPATVEQILVNQPIDFELKNLDPHHPYLEGRGFAPQTVAHFGLGFCSRGMMKGRIAIPIHDQAGRLVAYGGRLVSDEMIDAEHPKYLFPGRREHGGSIHEFHKSLLVYNLHRIGPVDDLIVVEGFASVWWLHQNGYASAVSLMGSSCSVEQAKLIAQHVAQNGRIWLIPDGNSAGGQLAVQALPLLASYRFTRLVTLEADQQPTDCDAQELRRLLGE